MSPPPAIGYLAPDGFLADLDTELEGLVEERFDRLLLARPPASPPAWVANTWLEPVRVPITSIGDAARKLRDIQRNWSLYPFANHRRAALIAEKLPKVSAKPIVFGHPAPPATLGAWTLIAPDLMLLSAKTTSPFVNGEPEFVEDRLAPPSRAYLKLWEFFTLSGIRPSPGDRCLDLGASPGGWTWVLASLGARVIAVDKAPLAENVAAMATVETRRESAFAVDPASIGPVDWLFSDVICYPDRLLKLVQRWLASGLARRIVCSVKFQGPTDFATQRAFAAIPGSRLMHLHHNKHELTWCRL
ncbi:MAG: hypothetical protein F9K44_13660 [Hyphomicrobiaceae bacterium]|nr:MAG: hypothetical protein F9K44_13660 [Hyphomicrobiaceae bacterium]